MFTFEGLFIFAEIGKQLLCIYVMDIISGDKATKLVYEEKREMSQTASDIAY